MIYESLNPAQVLIDRAELNRREFLLGIAESDLLNAIFASAGIAYGLTVGIQGDQATVAIGAAVLNDVATTRLVAVESIQYVAIPPQFDTYNVYIRADSSILTDSVTAPGAPPVTRYRRRARIAYSSGGLPPTSQSEVVGLSALSSSQNAGSQYTLLARVIRSATGIAIDPTFVATRAGIRGSGASGGLTGPVSETMLDTALRAKLATFLSSPLVADLDTASHKLLNVASMTGVTVAGVVQPIDANVTQVGGKTLAAIELDITNSAVAATQIITPYNISGTVVMSGTVPAPKPMNTTLPAGAIIAGKYYALAYDGEGTQTTQSGNVVYFTPNIRVGSEVSASWLQVAGSVVVGDARGVSGNLGAFFVSLLSIDSTTQIHHMLQKVTPVAGGNPTVSVFDSLIVTKLAGDPIPPPLSLIASGGQLVWGGRAEGVMVADAGDPANPAVTVLSVWVQGYKISRADSAGIKLQPGTLAVNGVILLVQSNTPITSMSVIV
jgi:hypothetical protein